MSTDIVKYAFIAGEISPTLFGRTDLTKFDLGMAEAKNFFVDYRGGLSSRPGTQFLDFIKDDDKATRFAKFAFSPDEEDTYVILFGDSYIRFLQSGAYVLEAAQNITGITQALPAVITVAGHGLSDGRWIKISGVGGMTEVNSRTYEVQNSTTNTFELYSVPDGQPVDSTAFTAYTSGGTIEPIYEIASPYAATDLAGLSFGQYRDRLTITSLDFAVRGLTRTSHTSWSIAELDFTDDKVGPSVSSDSKSSAGDAQTIFGITSVYEDGSESAIGAPYKVSSAVNYPVTEGSVSILWSPDSDAVSYNVYRSVVSVLESLSYGSELGYAGSTRGTKFTDPNISPDFGRVPPNNYDPFEPGAILSIQVTAGGSGYTHPVTVTVSGGGGSGCTARAVINDSGAIVSVQVITPGSGYSSPTVSFSGGTGATATATARASTGTYPALSAIFQQRQVYAASEIDPITIWGSQFKRFENFSFSDILLDTDSYEHTLDTPAVAPIKHMLSTRGGLLLLTQDNVWLLNGTAEGKPLTPTQALADPQTYTGVSDLDPLRIGEDILYAEGKGYSIRMLGYNEISRVYSGDDKSILSSHLFGKDRSLVEWDYQESPYKVVWSVREDGTLLSFTVVKSEDVFAWTPCETQGRFKDVITVRENTEDQVYLTVERFINGRWSKYLERLDLRQFENVEDAWCVDAGLSLGSTTPSGEITIYRDADDNYTAAISGGTFTGEEGKILRFSNGIFELTTVDSPTQATLTYIAEPTNWVPETDRAYTFPVPSGEWTLDGKVTTLSGLWHLEGEEVSILADGNVFPRDTVRNGSLTLPQGVTRAIVGLRYTCRAKTLPLIVADSNIEAKRKRIVGVAVRFHKSRGLKVGDDYEVLYEFPERSNEDYSAPIALQNGIRHTSVGTSWTEEGFTYFELNDPLPATMLSIVQDTEVGDDPD